MDFKKIRSLTLDALKKSRKKAFKPPTSAETKFNRALRKIARVSGHIVEAHVDGANIKDDLGMQKALRDYSNLLEPWARRQAAKMLAQVSKSNRVAYSNNSKAIGTELKLGVAEKDVGQVAAALMLEQVQLIKSIPLEAGLRAQKLAREALFNGSRADEIAQELLNTTSVTESRATLIARTETARANASFTESRASAVGANSYIWRTTMDGAERHSHAQMNGKLISYDKPPTLSDGTKGHAGTFPNCRCYQDVQFDDG